MPRHNFPALMVLACLMTSLVPAFADPGGAANDEVAIKSLAAHLAALKDTETLHAHFTCEKQLNALDTPLISRGQVLIHRGDPREGEGAVRFVTETPYVSELILAKGKVLARSQHETEWTKTNQSSRPGLTAVLSQLGGWSTGDTAKITDWYTITNSAETIPAMPSGKSETPPAADLYTLTPTNKDMLRAVKQITLAIDRTAHHLLYIEILTQQDDVTRYWFYDVKTNAKLPADAFSPDATPPATAPAAPPGARP